MRYVKVNNFLYSPEMVDRIDCSEIEKLIVRMHLITGETIEVEGLDAIDVVMQTKPSMVEGKRFSFKKGAWIIHNLIAHPLMQILALCRLTRVAIWIHEVTVPRPVDRHEKFRTNSDEVV